MDIVSFPKVGRTVPTETIRLVVRSSDLWKAYPQTYPKWRLGCLYWVQLRVGTCECVHSSPGSTSKNLRLPRGWAHQYSTCVQIQSWWLSSTEDSNLSSSQPLLGLHELWSCCYLRQACCHPYFHASMEIAQKIISVHGWVLWCNSMRGSCVCCHHSWHCFCMEYWCFGMFVFHHNYNCFIHMHVG